MFCEVAPSRLVFHHRSYPLCYNAIMVKAPLAPVELEKAIRIPSWVVDHPSFLRWRTTRTDEKLRVSYLQDELWLDPYMETDLHNEIKNIIGAYLTVWIMQSRLGRYYSDGMLLSCPSVSLSTEPDGIFLSETSWKQGKIQRKQGRQSVVLTGIPDMVLEVVSRSSRDMDLTQLMELYYDAGIPEYWLVDSTTAQPQLMIFEQGRNRYRARKHTEGWVSSTQLQAEFRLAVSSEQRNRLNHVNFERR